MGEDSEQDQFQSFTQRIRQTHNEIDTFRIEYSIPMRKPNEHFSRAPGVVLSILQSHKEALFRRSGLLGVRTRTCGLHNRLGNGYFV